MSATLSAPLMPRTRNISDINPSCLAGSQAILLAAGVGRRLGASYEGPKALLEFGGRSLLDRNLSALRACGVDAISITVGHRGDRIRAAADPQSCGAVAIIENPRYREGSLISLWVQRTRLREGRPVILMDADVLCDARMMARLAQGAAPNVLLVDRAIEPGDEPVKVCFRAGQIVDFRKRPERPHDWRGESVGFFRFSPDSAAELAERCEAYVASDRAELEYEEAIRDMILDNPARFCAVDVTDLPWTEIDFDEDVLRARDEILPELIA